VNKSLIKPKPRKATKPSKDKSQNVLTIRRSSPRKKKTEDSDFENPK
jgi:hypothetical protein